MVRIYFALLAEGEDSQWLSARKSSDESYAFNREVSGSRNVTRPSFNVSTLLTRVLILEYTIYC